MWTKSVTVNIPAAHQQTEYNHSRYRWLTKWAGQKVEIFQQVAANFWQNTDRQLQIFNKVYYRCLKFWLSPKFPPKWGFLAPNFAFLDEVFSDKQTIFQQFSDSQKIREGQLPPCSLAMIATDI